MIDVKINPADIARVRLVFRDIPKAIPRVLSRAINKTATHVRSEAAKMLRPMIGLKLTTIKKRVIIKSRATLKRWASVIGISGRRIPVIEFGIKPTFRGVGIKTQKGGKQFVTGAFVATMKTGHEGVFKRKQHDEFDTEEHGRRPWFAALGKSPYRSPIRELFGPSLGMILEGSSVAVLQTLISKSGVYLEKEVDRQIDVALKQYVAVPKSWEQVVEGKST